MKIILLALLSVFISAPKTVYEFKNVKSIDGKAIDLTKYRGKKILIVNTASKCGFTKQYADLEKLSKAYKGKVVVIGFPSDNFGGQEFADNLEIKKFCQENFGVSFPLSQRVDVKGDKMDPLFTYLTQTENPDFKGEIKWNFEKFLIDENGKLVHRFRSNVNPMSEEITKYL